MLIFASLRRAINIRSGRVGDGAERWNRRLPQPPGPAEHPDGEGPDDPHRVPGPQQAPWPAGPAFHIWSQTLQLKVETYSNRASFLGETAIFQRIHLCAHARHRNASGSFAESLRFFFRLFYDTGIRIAPSNENSFRLISHYNRGHAFALPSLISSMRSMAQHSHMHVASALKLLGLGLLAGALQRNGQAFFRQTDLWRMRSSRTRAAAVG